MKKTILKKAVELHERQTAYDQAIELISRGVKTLHTLCDPEKVKEKTPPQNLFEAMSRGHDCPVCESMQAVKDAMHILPKEKAKALILQFSELVTNQLLSERAEVDVEIELL